jgi:hypothetical protein
MQSNYLTAIFHFHYVSLSFPLFSSHFFPFSVSPFNQLFPAFVTKPLRRIIPFVDLELFSGCTAILFLPMPATHIEINDHVPPSFLRVLPPGPASGSYFAIVIFQPWF